MSDSFDSFVGGFIFGMAFLFALIFIASIISGFSSTIHIDKETANSICVNLTGIKTAEGSQSGDNMPSFKLVCTIPSFDSTNNIIIKKAGQ